MFKLSKTDLKRLQEKTFAAGAVPLGKKSKLWSLDKKPRIAKIKKNTLTMEQWYNKGPASRRKTAARDRVTVEKLLLSKENPNLILSQTLTHERKGSGRILVRRWKHKIIRLEPDKKFYKAKVMFFCNCPDWWATWEWVAEKRGNTQMIRGNSEPPDVRNPGYKMGLCKHGLTVFRYMMDKKI